MRGAASHRDAIQCPGCYQTVDIAATADVTYEIHRGPGPDGREAITITLGA